MDIHISDNGNEFINLIAEGLYKRTGVQHHITTPHHPQASGLVERLNHTTTNILKTMIKEQLDWVEALPTIAWIDRSTCHASTNYEPLRLMTGHKPKLPSECKKVGTSITKFRNLTEEVD